MTTSIQIYLATAATAMGVACTFAPLSASADQNEGWVVGAGAGEFHSNQYVATGLPPGTYYGAGYHNTAFQLFGGWRFSPYLALEGSYMNLGRYGEGSGYHNDAQGFAPWLVGTLPLWRPKVPGWGPIELFGKVGQYFYHYHSDFSGYSMPFDHYYNDFVFGGGIGAVISTQFEVRAEADKLNLANSYDAYAWWVTLGYRF